MCCYEHIYPVPNPCCLLLINIFLPGIGTMLQSYYFNMGWNCGTFFVGFLQLITAPIIIGWIWAVWHSCQVKAVSENPQVIIVQGGY